MQASDLNDLHIAIKSKSLYVVLMKTDAGKLTLLVDPGLNRPYSNKNKAVADFMAKNVGGEARTWADAWDLLLKENPQFENELFKRVANRDIAQHIIPNKTKPNAGRN